jgi:hypothetical protein
MASRGKYLIVLGELEWFYTLIEEHPPPKNWFSEIEWTNKQTRCADLISQGENLYQNLESLGHLMDFTAHHAICNNPGQMNYQCGDELATYQCENPPPKLYWETSNFIKFKRSLGFEVDVAFVRNRTNLPVPSGQLQDSYVTALDWSYLCQENNNGDCAPNPRPEIEEYFEQNSDLKFLLLIGVVSENDNTHTRHTTGDTQPSDLDIRLTGKTSIVTGWSADTKHQLANFSDTYYQMEKNNTVQLGGDASDVAPMPSIGSNYKNKKNSYQTGRWSCVSNESVRRMKIKTIQYTRLDMVENYYDNFIVPITSIDDWESINSDTQVAMFTSNVTGAYSVGTTQNPDVNVKSGKNYLNRLYGVAGGPAKSTYRQMALTKQKLYNSGIWKKLPQGSVNTNNPAGQEDDTIAIVSNLESQEDLPYVGTDAVKNGAHINHFPSHIWFYRGWSGSYGFSKPSWKHTSNGGIICHMNSYGDDKAVDGSGQELINYSHPDDDNSAKIFNPWMPTINIFATCDLGDLSGPGWFVEMWQNVATNWSGLSTGEALFSDTVAYKVPMGAVATFGPSDVHLSTKWNMIMGDGVMNALTFPWLEFLGQAVENGKVHFMEAFNGSAGLVELIDATDTDARNCYDVWYNLSGDPGLPIWRVRPDVIMEPEDFITDNNGLFITNLITAETTINADPLMTQSFTIRPTQEDSNETIEGTYATIMYADRLIDTVFADEETGVLNFDLYGYTEWENNTEYCSQFLEVPDFVGGPYCDGVDGCIYHTSFPPAETDGCKPVFDVWINKFTLPQYEQKHVQILIDPIHLDEGCMDELDQSYDVNATISNPSMCSNMSIYENSIIITEINDRWAGTEFIEIFNSSDTTINLGGFRIYAIGFTNVNEMPNINIGPNEYIVLAEPDAIENLESLNNHLVRNVNLFRWPEGDYIWNQGELIRITDPNNNEVDSVDTNLLLQWYASPGIGTWELTTFSLENGGNAYPGNWAESNFAGGTPGKRYRDWQENEWNRFVGANNE